MNADFLSAVRAMSAPRLIRVIDAGEFIFYVTTAVLCVVELLFFGSKGGRRWSCRQSPSPGRRMPDLSTGSPISFLSLKKNLASYRNLIFRNYWTARVYGK